MLRSARRRTASRQESTAKVDPVQRVRGRLASHRARRLAVNIPGRNGIFGLGNFRPRLGGRYGRRSILAVPLLVEGVSHPNQTSSTCLGEGGLSPDHPQWFPPWRQQTGSGRRRWLPVCRRCFLDGGDFPRSAQSVPTLGTFKDRTSGPLPPRWKTSKSAYSRTWDKSDSLKKQVPHTWYQSKQTPLSMMRRSTTCRRRG